MGEIKLAIKENFLIKLMCGQVGQTEEKKHGTLLLNIAEARKRGANSITKVGACSHFKIYKKTI